VPDFFIFVSAIEGSRWRQQIITNGSCAQVITFADKTNLPLQAANRKGCYDEVYRLYVLNMKKESNNQLLTAAHNDFARGLSRYANSKVHSTVLGDDLVQATFMKAWLYLQKSGKIDLMRAFLYHVLNNLIVDEYRKKKMSSLDLLADHGFDPEALNPENILNTIDGKTLAALIQKLPEKYRSAITMRYTNDLSLKEMSVLANTSENTMSVRVFRGLAQLKILSLASV
jgi:RNA polymerase sigma-70 factor (ECF subfamily)